MRKKTPVMMTKLASQFKSDIAKGLWKGRPEVERETGICQLILLAPLLCSEISIENYKPRRKRPSPDKTTQELPVSKAC